MEGDALLPVAPVVAAVDVKPSKQRITCEFCESQLAANGDVLSLGAKAKEYRDKHESLASVRAERDEWKRRAELSEARLSDAERELLDASERERAAAEKAAAGGSKSSRWL